MNDQSKAVEVPLPERKATVWFHRGLPNFDDYSLPCEGSHDLFTEDQLKAYGDARAAAASNQDIWSYCWLVELFEPNEGNSKGYYHTGFTTLSGESRSTRDVHKARKYESRAAADAIAAKLGGTLSGIWRPVEHGFHYQHKNSIDAKDAA